MPKKSAKMRNFLIRTALYIIIKALGGVWGGPAVHDFFCEAGQGLTVSCVYLYIGRSGPAREGLYRAWPLRKAPEGAVRPIGTSVFLTGIRYKRKV